MTTRCLTGVLLLSTIGFAQEGAAQQSPAARRLSTELSEEAASAAVAMSRLMGSAGVPGGIVSARSCGSDAPVALRVPVGKELGEALDEVLTRTGGSLRRDESGGVLTVIPKAGIPALLAVKIDRLMIEDPALLVRALDQIEQVPGFRQEVAASRLVLRGPEIGYSDLRSRNEGKPAARPPMEIRSETVLEALNQVAARHGRAIWLYEEIRCLGRPTSVVLDFVWR